MIKFILFVLALLMLTACTGTRDRRTASHYDPCEQMKVEAELAGEIEEDVGVLSRQADFDPAPGALADSAAKVTAESLLARKEDQLAMTLQSMQQNADACASRSRGLDADDL